MPRRLYIFVDESGSPGKNERCYSLVGCWCVSSNLPENTLTETQHHLSRLAKDSGDLQKPPTELKGSKLSGVIEHLIESMEKFAYTDTTIQTSNLPWQPSTRPLRFSMHDVCPAIGVNSLAETIPEPDAPSAIQTLGLIRILRPIFNAGVLDLRHIDSIRVCLDDTTWANPRNHLSAGFDSVDSPEITVEIYDSEKAPGIQLADLGAFAMRKNVMENQYQRSVNTLRSLSFLE